MTKDNVWYLQCLGEIRAEQNGRVVDRFHTQKTAALLALLALRGGQNRESVCALLWPDKAPESARNSLSACLSALRRDLGPDIIEADRQRVTLASGVVKTDVEEFDRALKSANYARAVELYRGPLLPNFHEDPFPALAGEYEEKARGAFCHRIEELEETADFDALRSIARRAALLFGDDERWFLALMRAHRRADDVEAALRTYEALGRYARKNGDVASETARALAKLLRREREQQLSRVAASSTSESVLRVEKLVIEELETTPVQVLKSNLPPAWTRFFGREAERTLLSDWLSEGNRGGLLITLSGSGGSGKTRLAIETLRSTSDEAESLVFFVALASLTDAELLHGTARDAIGLAVAPNITPLEQLKKALNGQKALFLLDNFEQLMPEGAEKLQVLRAALPDAAFLVTSRVLLNLPGEREFPVAPLPTPLPNSTPVDVGSSPSAALFCDRAGLVVDKSNAEAVSALCRRLDGIPLALELAAARAKVLSPAQILERLSSHPNFLQSREFGLPARHQTLRATIEWSTQLLSPELRQFFGRLSVFRGGWTFDAAEIVCDNVDALDALTVLRESSLIRVDARGSGSRFRMLETLREFGQEQLGEEKSAVERAFFDYFLQLAQQAASAMQGPEQTTWLGRLDTEQDNLRAALDWAQVHDASRGLQLATALIDFWETRLSLDEGRHWIETFLRATEPKLLVPQASPPPPLLGEGGADGLAVQITELTVQQTLVGEVTTRSRALSGAGRLAWYANDFTSAESLLSQGLQAAQQSEDASTAVYALHSSARLAAVAGDIERARELGLESVRISREAHDKALLLASLVDLGPTYILTAAFSQLGEICDEAIGLARELRDEHALALALYMHAIGDFYEGRYHVAQPLLVESETLCRRLGARWDLMVCLGVVGSVWRELNEFDKAQSAFDECLILAREPLLESIVVNNVLLATAYLFIRRGDYRDAVCLIAGCDALAEKISCVLPPYLVEERERFLEIARSHLSESDFNREWRKGRGFTTGQTIDFVLRIDRENGSNVDSALMATRARALSGAGRLSWYDSQMTQANSLLEQGLNAAKQSGDAAALIYASRTLARVAAIDGDIERARQLGAESVRLSREAQDKALLLESLIDLSFAHFNLPDLPAAQLACEEALGLAQEVGDEHAIALTFATLASISDREERFEEAISYASQGEVLCRRLGAHWESMVCAACKADSYSHLGDLVAAQNGFIEALSIAREHFLNSWNVVTVFMSVCSCFLRRGDAVGAVRVRGASDALAESIDYKLMPTLVPEYEQTLVQLRETLGEDSFNREYKRGRGMLSEEAIDFAISRPIDVKDFVSNESELIATRSRALSGAGRLAWHDSDFNTSRHLVMQGLDTARQSGDAASFVVAVAAFVRFATTTGDVKGDIAQALSLAREAVEISRSSGDKALLLESLISLCYAAVTVGNFLGMRAIHREAIAIARELGDENRLVQTLVSFAMQTYCEENYSETRDYLAESMEISRRLNSPFTLFSALFGTANVARETGDFELAERYIGEALELCRDNQAFRWNVSNGLYGASYLRAARGDLVRAAQIMGAAYALGEQVGYKLVPILRLDFERYRSLIHQKIGEAAFQEAWNIGVQMTLDAALDFARGDAPKYAQDEQLLAARSRALSGAGRLAWHNADLEAARQLVHRGLDAAQQSGDLQSFVEAVAAFVRFAMVTGDVEGYMAQSRILSEEAARRCREAGNEALLLESLLALGYAHCIVGNLNESLEVNHEAAELGRKLGDSVNLARVLTNLSSTNYHLGRYVSARSIVNETTNICRELNSPWDLIASLWVSSSIAREQGNLELAFEDIAEVLEICRANPAFRWGVANVLLTMSYLRVARGEEYAAAQMMGATQTLWEETGYHLVPILRVDYDRFKAMAFGKLGREAFEEAWEIGRAMTHEAAIEFALKNEIV